MTKTVKETDGAPDQKEEDFLLVFFEQFLAVLRLLVDRADSPSEDVLGNADLAQTLLSLTGFVDRFSEQASLRLKVKFCAFCENALARTDSFGLRKDEFVRNNLLDVVVEWIQPEVSIYSVLESHTKIPDSLLGKTQERAPSRDYDMTLMCRVYTPLSDFWSDSDYNPSKYQLEMTLLMLYPVGLCGTKMCCFML